MDCNLPGSCVHGIFQARVLEWGAIAFSRRSSIQSAKTRPGADCGSDHELLIAKFRLKLKKVGKTTTMEVTNRFKGLDLVDRVPKELWTEEPGGLQSMGLLRVGHD